MTHKKIGFFEAFSIGVGGMVGGGIFAVLGLTILLAHGAAFIAFIVAGLIALITSYSYAKLSVRFPSEGGTIEFITKAFGTGLFSGWINVLLLSSYIIMMSLYSYAFGSYSAALFFGKEVLLAKQLFIVGVVLVFTLINLLGAYVTGKAEDLMVFVKILILLAFAVVGFITIKVDRLEPQNWAPMLNIITGGLIIFLAYEGFELIANTAQDIVNPVETLPKAFYASVGFVIALYVLIAIVAVGNLTYDQVVKYKDYALAIAAEPFFGKAGFIIIGIAAMLSTASAINATLYGSGRISYLITKYGQLPRTFGKRIWKGGYEGIVILGVITIIFTLSTNLENISVAGSLGFLIVFGLVNLANYKLSKLTDSNKWLPMLGFLLCLASALVLVGYNLKQNPSSLKAATIFIVISFLFEAAYEAISGRRMRYYVDWKLEEREHFIKRVERFIPSIIKGIKKEVKDGEIYMLHHLAKGEKEKASTVDLVVFTDKKMSNEEKEKTVAKIMKHAQLKNYHPVNIEIRPREEKEEVQKEHKELKKVA